LAKICQCFGVSRQAYYQHYWFLLDRSLEEQIVIKLVLEQRKAQPKLGTRKLYHVIESDLLRHSIKMGRDAFFDLLGRHGLLLRTRKRKPKTTFSHHYYYKYANEIQGLEMSRPNQVWVADLTYLKTKSGFLYLSLITDAYSKKILGYQVADSLAAAHSVVALKKALALVAPSDRLGLIHHSDRGIQYCSTPYTSLLEKERIRISMTQSGDPRENAIAERVNGIIKNELLAHVDLQEEQDTKEAVCQAIDIYNKQRPHLSCSYYTPHEVHQNYLKVEKVWKTKKSTICPQVDEGFVKLFKDQTPLVNTETDLENSPPQGAVIL